MNNKFEIPYFSFNKAPDALKEKWKIAIEKVIDKGQFIGGEQVENFETEFGNLIHSPNVVSVGNGLDGLVLAMRALGLGSGSRVAVPAHTFIATWLAIDLIGAIPVGIDVDRNGLLNLNKLFEVTPIIDAVIPVHIHGAMVDMLNLSDWAKNNNVLVIEDASQSHLANTAGRYAGTWGDAGVFSLYPSKNLGALGDAGIISFKDSQNAATAMSLRSYGAQSTNKYDHKELGINSRLDAIQAAVLRENLLNLAEWNAKRMTLAKLYCDTLHPLAEVLQGDAIYSVRHHFPILVNSPKEFCEYLLSNGIHTERHYPKTAASLYYKIKNLSQPQDFEISERISNRTVSLPISQWHSEQDIEFVCSIINQGIRKKIINY
jgi:dTDP-4-amino-4,6-dideoxygalactose transaminase